MARYSANNYMGGSQQNISNAFKTMLVVTAATGATTLRRGWIDEVFVGADGAPVSTECQLIWDWSVQTAAGTATAVTPQPTPDGSDAAALLVYAANATAEGTITANSDMLSFITNQRQSQRVTWADFRLTPLIVPAVNLKGIAGRCKNTTASSYASTVSMQEYVVE